MPKKKGRKNRSETTADAASSNLIGVPAALVQVRVPEPSVLDKTAGSSCGTDETQSSVIKTEPSESGKAHPSTGKPQVSVKMMKEPVEELGTHLAGSDAAGDDEEDIGTDDSASDESESRQTSLHKRQLVAVTPSTKEQEQEELVLQRALHVSLAPEGQGLRCLPEPPSSTSLTAAYMHFGTLVLSQEQRMLVGGTLREDSGYDLDDDFVQDEKEPLEPGAPVVMIGTGQPAAYLKAAAGDSHSLRLLGPSPSSILKMPRNRFLPLPTRAPEMGEWCLVFGDEPLLKKWYGVRGFCGPRVKTCVEGDWHSVTFESSNSEMQTTTLPLKNLAALPLELPGSTPAPLEAPVAPPQALPPLLKSEAALLAKVGQESSTRGTIAPPLLVERAAPLTLEQLEDAPDNGCGKKGDEKWNEVSQGSSSQQGSSLNGITLENSPRADEGEAFQEVPAMEVSQPATPKRRRLKRSKSCEGRFSC